MDISTGNDTAGALLHHYFAGSAVGVAHDVHAALLIGEAAAAKVVVTTDDRIRSLNLHMTDAFGNGCSECLLLPVGRAALGAHERAEDIGCHRFQVVENHLHHLSRSQHRLVSFLSGC